MSDPRGTQWSVWDLHVHTPSSIEHNYSGAEPWDRFISELASLPVETKVIGISDYWFLDGYRRVVEAKESGKLPNIETIFPVIEIRCDTFGGSESGLKRLNLHLILDPEFDTASIEAQLRPLMKAKYSLRENEALQEWHELPTPDSMERLGQIIIDAAPEAVKKKMGRPLRVGFNNLSISFKDLVEGIGKNTALRDRVMIAVGKVEWEAIRWDQAAGLKATLANSVDMIFTAAPDRDSYFRTLTKLREKKVNDRLIDCSDAHAWLDSSQANRLATSMTWINAEHSFKGLRQALHDFNYRVSVEKRPAALERAARAPSKVIREVRLRRLDESENSYPPHFSSILPINSGLSVIIGNKGQGKSALLDCIASAANSDRQEDFSFLTAERFRVDSGRIASRYETEIEWADSSTSVANMNDSHTPARAVLVDYLPQSLIESVCAADPDSIEKQIFEQEIERVIFRHIPTTDRGAAPDLRSYLREQSVGPEMSAKARREEVASAALALMSVRRRLSELDRMQLEMRLEEQRRRIELVKTARIEAQDELATLGGTAGGAHALALQEAEAVRAGILREKEELEAEKSRLSSEVFVLSEAHDRMVLAISAARDVAFEIAAIIGLPEDDYISVTLDQSAFDAYLNTRKARTQEIESIVSESGDVGARLLAAENEVLLRASAFESAGESSSSIVQRISDLDAQIGALEGTPSVEDSLAGMLALLTERDSLPAIELESMEALKQAFFGLHLELHNIMSMEVGAFGPAMDFVDTDSLAQSVKLGFDVEFRVRDFTSHWMRMINKQKLGDFYDLDGASLDKTLFNGVNFREAQSIWDRLLTLVSRMSTERGSETGNSRSLDAITRSGFSAEQLLTYVYSLEWLKSQYIIRSEGRELSELSPGQRGLVLLLFYLVVDRSDKPLLLDQPEENLDNQTVKNVLVPALRHAVERRQVIAVTHNPNFAIVGDADQIVLAEMSDGAFAYKSGSLAALAVGESAINVLEGTREAFASRDGKYRQVVGRYISSVGGS